MHPLTLFSQKLITALSLPLKPETSQENHPAKIPTSSLFPKQVNLLIIKKSSLPNSRSQQNCSLKLNPFKIKIKPMSASSIDEELDQESKTVRLRYPTESVGYVILKEIGGGASATIHKAICGHSKVLETSLLAIKRIDLEQYSPPDIDSLRRETMAMSLHSHPNVLVPHCSFVDDGHYLWVIMPYMAAGSLQSIISYCFPDGLLEPCIAIVLKETLKGLCYLHGQGRLHTDIKGGNILLDHTDNGSIKLEDSGMSVSIYDSSSIVKSFSLSSPSKMRLTDVAGTPYWMAPEVIHDSDTSYSFKSDIWTFGVTALELAHGGPPFSHLIPPSKSLIMKIKERFGLSDYDHDEKHKKDFKNKKFSKEFKDMVASCLDQDPSRRPSADRLLEHSFFKNCKGLDFLFSKIFHELPNVEERFQEAKALHNGTSSQITAGSDTVSMGLSVKTGRISGWKFNEGEFKLDPEFCTESEDDAVVKMVRYGGESIVNPDTNIGFSESSGDLDGLVGDQDRIGANLSGIEGIVEGFNPKTVLLEGLVALKRSLDEQKRQVVSMIVQLGGEADGEEQMVQRIENLMEQLDLEKEKDLKLKTELERATVWWL